MENNKFTLGNIGRISNLRILVLFSVLSSALFAQPTSYTKYWIQFKDKNNSPYSISNPSQFLSARAIQRRTNQNISYAQNDLPVNPAYIDSVRNVPNITVL